MGIRNIIAIVGLSFAAATVQAGTTNSWRATGASGFWDASGAAWSLNGPPSITDTADFITNANTKIITIDSAVVSDSPATLTISNLTLGGTSTATNTLLLNTLGTNVPLHVLNAMTVSNAAVLQITNSFLQVDGDVGGIFLLTGSMRILNGAKVQLNKAFVSTAVLQFALGTNSGSVAVSSDLTLGGTLNIINGGGFTATNYTLFTYGGGLNYNGLVIGTIPTNVGGAFIDISVLGQVSLVVTGGVSSVSTGSLQIVSIVRNTNDILIGWTASVAGNNAVQAVNGGVAGYSTNNFQDISGSINVTAGVTNNYLDVGGATNTPSRFYRVRIVP